MKLKKFALLLVLAVISATSSFAQNDTTTSFKVFASCGMCKMRIEKALKIKGVRKARYDVGSKMLTVTYSPAMISLDKLHSTMAEIGHDTELKKAKDEVYNALPDCCHYREGGHDTEEADSTVAEDENKVTGMVVSADKKGNFSPLAGASVYWLGTAKGVVTNDHGIFSIDQEPTGKLVVSYTGFRTDTIQVKGAEQLQIIMEPSNSLRSITVISRPKSTLVNTASPIRVTTITSKELLKAACCNLSESFETNPSVDVSFTDAVTGAKQIQLLGLSGAYTQLTVENLPGPRGLATPLGLNSIAGPWVESIQLSKGTGSVVNGFESIAGQINVELKKPENMEQLYANGYINSMGKTDLNLNLSKRINDKWTTALLLHDDFLYNKRDQNNDGFRDQPTGNQFSAINRWKYDNGKGLMFQFGAKAMIDDKTGGQVAFNKSDKGTTNAYGVGFNTERYEGFAKIGYVFPGKKYKSIGLQLSAFDHQQDSYFGLSEYNGRQKNFYSNLIYQNIIGTTDHKIRAGLSFSADDITETVKAIRFQRREIVPGAFAEYTYTMSEKFSVVGGLRVDHNSLFGWFATPRINARYAPFEGTTIRLSAGRGQRTANIFAENIGFLVSARTIQLLTTNTGKAYGLDPEVAWNKGITIDQQFRLFGREALLSLDYFRNDFSNQVIVDMEDPRYVKFYNLNGRSFSNSFQAEISAIPVKALDVRLAYRWFDVQSTYSGMLLQKPLIARNRAFANLAYETHQWKFDYTLNITGTKRIPSTANNPPAHRFETASPSFVTMNAQVSKTIGKQKNIDLYLGGENITNFMQDMAILSADAPFSSHFDASLIWGPMNGRLIYAGFRYKIK